MVDSSHSSEWFLMIKLSEVCAGVTEWLKVPAWKAGEPSRALLGSNPSSGELSAYLFDSRISLLK